MDVADRAPVASLHNDLVLCHRIDRGPITRSAAARTGTAPVAG